MWLGWDSESKCVKLTKEKKLPILAESSSLDSNVLHLDMGGARRRAVGSFVNEVELG